MSKSTQPSLRVRPRTGRPFGTVASRVVELLLPTRLPVARVSILTIPLVACSLAACGGSEPSIASEVDDVSGVSLVGGVALERQGLLVIPRDGGTAELRALLDPGEVLWRGQSPLPAAVDAHTLGRLIVLRAPSDSVFTYDPDRDLLHGVGEIEGEPAWTGSDEGAVYYTPERILAVRGRDGRLIAPEGRVLWASPASGGRVVALLAAPSSTLLAIWGEDVGEPESSQEVDAGLPGLVTAWGERLILSRTATSELVQFGLPDLEPAESVRLEAPPLTLAASPSSHRIYAGLEGETDLVSVDRFTWRQRDQGRFQTPVREVRPSTTGDHLLVFDGSQVWLLTPESDEPLTLDLDWRSDLPVGLPGGGVLGVRDGSLWISREPRGVAAPLDGPSGAWWLPVSWVPPRQRIRMAARSDAAEMRPESPSGAVDDDAVSEPVAAAETGPDVEPAVQADPAIETAAPVVSVPPGFYAIAASSQRAGGVHDLSEALEGDGYPTQVVPRRDEANEIWYRLMVGPYTTRAEAEDILVQLRRERGIQGWVREVAQEGFGPGDGEQP